MWVLAGVATETTPFCTHGMPLPTHGSTLVLQVMRVRASLSRDFSRRASRRPLTPKEELQRKVQTRGP